MLAKDEWAALIPHQGAMSLLDQVVEWETDSLRATCVAHLDPHNPLRREGRLHAVHLSEIGAQAMAVHGALKARAEGGSVKPGWLVALRDVQLAVEWLDDLAGPLDVHARCLVATDAALQYAFMIEHQGCVLASGRATVQLGTTDQRGSE